MTPNFPSKTTLYAVVSLPALYQTEDYFEVLRTPKIESWHYYEKDALAAVEKNKTWKAGAVVPQDFDMLDLVRILNLNLKVTE